ncbi:protein TIC 21, chloroplastic-like [Zingiber officinale]|uniref:protein TIC 21, chloroplastic-like n=1 Tax=Zingiber officinale TaxID=94328 RepID=UPI001C4B68A3|nr:protein TIC 21, chloroplastic-like [Zingiber officinale]
MSVARYLYDLSQEVAKLRQQASGASSSHASKELVELSNQLQETRKLLEAEIENSSKWKTFAENFESHVKSEIIFRTELTTKEDKYTNAQLSSQLQTSKDAHTLELTAEDADLESKNFELNFLRSSLTMVKAELSFKESELKASQDPLADYMTAEDDSDQLDPPLSSKNLLSYFWLQLKQVSKRLEDTARYFKRLGSIGFWGQLLCTIVSAVILSFSTFVTGKIATPVTFYPTAGAIAVAYISVFWFFGYIQLSEKLQRTANEPSKAPPRAEVVKNLKNGIVLNVLGMGAAILGMQATIGLLVAKALTTLSVPYYQGIAPGKYVVLAMDVFLVQSSSNTVLSHLLGLVLSLELLRSVTVPHLEAVHISRAL